MIYRVEFIDGNEETEMHHESSTHRPTSFRVGRGARPGLFREIVYFEAGVVEALRAEAARLGCDDVSEVIRVCLLQYLPAVASTPRCTDSFRVGRGARPGLFREIVYFEAGVVEALRAEEARLGGDDVSEVIRVCLLQYLPALASTARCTDEANWLGPRSSDVAGDREQEMQNG